MTSAGPPDGGEPLTGAGPLDGGEALIRAASDLGAEYIFCSAGSEWAPVWEAFARRAEAGTPGPRYLDLAHETTAAYPVAMPTAVVSWARSR